MGVGYAIKTTTFQPVGVYQRGEKFPLGEASIKGPIDIGFKFPFCGRMYRQVWASSEGFLTFMDGQAFGSVPGKYVKALVGMWQDYKKGG